MRKNLGGRLVKRIIAIALAAVITLGTLPGSVYAAEVPAAQAQTAEAPAQASTASEVKEALQDAIEEEVEAALTSGSGLVIATSPKEAHALVDIVGDEIGAINDEADALENLGEAQDIIEDAEDDIDESGDLDTVDDEANKAEDAQQGAEDAQQTAEDAQQTAEDAAAAAAAAGTSGAAGTAVGEADTAADTAEEAAEDAQTEEENAQVAYDAAKEAYDSAKKIADDAMALAMQKVADGAEDADEAVAHATEAYETALKLQVKYDEAAADAKQDWESKAEELKTAQKDLDKKMAALNTAKAESQAAALAVKEANDAVKKAQLAAEMKEDNFDAAKAALNAALAALDAAEKAVQDAWDEMIAAGGDVKEAEAALNSARAALKTANELVAKASEEVDKLGTAEEITYAEGITEIAARLAVLDPTSDDYKAAEKEMNQYILANTLKASNPATYEWKTTTSGEVYCEVGFADGTTKYYVYNKNADLIEFYELEITTTDSWSATNGNGDKLAVVVDNSTGTPVYSKVVIDGVEYQIMSRNTEVDVVTGQVTKYYYNGREINLAGQTLQHDRKGSFYTIPGIGRVNLNQITSRDVDVVEKQTVTSYYYTGTTTSKVTTYSLIYRGKTYYFDKSSSIIEQDDNGKYYVYTNQGWLEVTKSEKTVSIPTEVALKDFVSTTDTVYNKNTTATTTSDTVAYVTLMSNYKTAFDAKTAAVEAAEKATKAKEDAVVALEDKKADFRNAQEELAKAVQNKQRIKTRTNWGQLVHNVMVAQEEYNKSLRVLAAKKATADVAVKAKKAADAKVVAANLAAEKAYDKIYGVKIDRRGIHFTGLIYQERDLRRAYEFANVKAKFAAKLVEETFEAKNAAINAADIFDKLVLEGAKEEELAAAAAKVEAAYSAWLAAIDASDAADAAAEAARAAYEAALASYNAIRAKELANQPVIDGDGLDEAAIVRTVVTAPAQLPTVQATTIDEAPVALTATPTTTRRARTVATADTTEIEEEATPEVAQPEVVEDVVEDETANVDADTTEIADEETALASTMEENGFAWWWILILIAVVTGGSYAGYRYYKSKKVIEE